MGILGDRYPVLQVNNERKQFEMKAGGNLKSTQLYLEKGVTEPQKERNKLFYWLLTHTGHFLFDFDYGSICLPNLSLAVPFCLNVTNTGAYRWDREQGE